MEPEYLWGTVEKMEADDMTVTKAMYALACLNGYRMLNPYTVGLLRRLAVILNCSKIWLLLSEQARSLS
jgi:hypothetical protein